MYAIPNNINYMATGPRAKRQKPEHGRRLVTRRAELGLSLARVEAITNGIIYDQLLWRLENGVIEPGDLKASQRAALAEVLEWQLGELDAALGLVDLTGSFHGSLTNDSFVKNPTPQALPGVSNLVIPLKGLGNSKEGGPVLITPEQLGDHVADDCFTIFASGSTIACDEIKADLREGCTIYFDRTMSPQENDTVAYEAGGDYLMLPYEPTLRPRWVTSYDGAKALRLAPGDPELNFLGVMWWFTPPRRG